MNAIIGTQELELFQRAVEQRLGLSCEESRSTHVAEVLRRRVAARRLSVGAYLAALLTELEASDELSVLARELTVGETHFFRDSCHFEALREAVMPERVSARAATRHLRFLSAGCGSGEEAYSLLMLLRELELEPGFQYSVHGVDLNRAALAKAEAGVYPAWSLRETSEPLKRRWFVSEGRDYYRLKPELLACVRFTQHNLILDSPALLAPGSFDVIFCRNVLKYCTIEHAAAIVERLTRALAPSGFLFLGQGETLRGLSHDFQLRHTQDAFYYQRRDARTAPQAPAGELVPPPETSTDSRASCKESGLHWLDVVGRSGARTRSPSEATGSSTRASLRAPTPPRPFELRAHEHFDEALVMMQRLSSSENSDPAALLLRASLLTHEGNLSEAESTCHELLRLDDLDAGAHYLLAVCSERNGRAEAAIEHDRTAVYLDARFAMPHLHLGFLARRRFDAALARRELTTALRLLEGEDASRLLLFGGGFSRAALLSLCRSELANVDALPANVDALPASPRPARLRG